MITKEECQQAIDNLWQKWDNTNSDVIRLQIQVALGLLDSTINEIEISAKNLK